MWLEVSGTGRDVNGGILSRGRPIKVHQSQRAGSGSVVGEWQEGEQLVGKPVMRPLEKCRNARESSKTGEEAA